jgi:hypothetical protein
MSRSLTIVLGVIIISAPSAFAADPPEPDIAKLVRYLGSPEFRDRQKAQTRLLEIGPTALPELRIGTKYPDAEVARACEVLVGQIRSAERQAIISGKKDMPGNAGKRFKDLVGDSKSARTLFVDMVEDERRALVAEQAAAKPASVAPIYRAEASWVEETWKKRFAEFEGRALTPEVRVKLRRASQEAVTPGEVTLVLFLGSYALPAVEKDASDVDAVLKASFLDVANLDGFKEPFRKLFVTWLENRRDEKAVKSGLSGAMFAIIPEAVPIARRVIADPKAEASLLGTSALMLGNFGSLDDLALLEKLRNDARLYSTVLTQKIADEVVQVQVRDQAIGMCIQLRNRKTRFETSGFEFGSPSPWWGALYSRPYKSVQQFESDKARETAHVKAWAWLERQAKEASK